MLWIVNQREPEELRSWRRQNEQGVNSSYASLPGDVRSAVREALLADQKYLCAYTMKRIQLGHCHIEHFKPQSVFPELQVDYGNMFVCYPGDKEGMVPYGAKYKENSCETILNPRAKEVDTAFSYSSTGEIVGKSSLAQRTIEVLNLNYPQLCDDRRRVMRSFRKMLMDSQAGSSRCLQMLADYETRNRLPEYYGVIRQVLIDHARRRKARAQRISREKRG